MIEFLAGISKRVKTLATDYTTARAAKLDYLDAAISAVSPIQSIQRGTIAMGTLSTKTATISAVTTGKTQLNWLGVDSAVGAPPEDYCITLTLTNSTTVTASRNGTGNGCHVSYEVIQYK